MLEQRPGVRLLSAMQGRLGIELARQHRPDLVLLDLHLPDLPGEEVLRRLDDDERTAFVDEIARCSGSQFDPTWSPRSCASRRPAGLEGRSGRPTDDLEAEDVVASLAEFALGGAIGS